MTTAEQQYAMDRVKGISQDKIGAIREVMPVTKPPILTYGEALKLIKAGKIKLRVKPARTLHYSDDFRNVFSFDSRHDFNGRETIDEKAFEKKAAPIRKERQRIQDQIMLGDAEKALKLIEAFA